MKKLIKLSDEHYIIVDDSEIKEGDYYLDNSVLKDKIYQMKYSKWGEEGQGNCKKITHSTQPLGFLQEEGITTTNLKHDWVNVKQLSLLEVEEAIYGYSVVKMAEEAADDMEYDYDSPYGNGSNDFIDGYIKGFKAHKELVKDKLFLTHKNLFEFLYFARTHSQYSDKAIVEEFIQSLLPKTEWEIEFDEQNKITLIKLK
ncbi:hypothetical protein [Leptolyngbya phage Lbo-JY46]